MQIPKEILSEVNYEGSRLIEIEDENIKQYKKLIDDLQTQANPILDAMDLIDKNVLPYREQVNELKDENQQDYEEIKPLKEQYVVLAKVLPEDATEGTPEMKELEEKMAPAIERIKNREAEISKIRAEMRPIKDEWDAEHEKVQDIDKRAAVIKEKMIPFVAKDLEGKLGEFEESKHLIEKDGKIYAEVFDSLEEFIKTYRAKRNV